MQELVTRIAQPEEFAQPDPSRFIKQACSFESGGGVTEKLAARCHGSGRWNNRWRTSDRVDRSGCAPFEHICRHPRPVLHSTLGELLVDGVRVKAFSGSEAELSPQVQAAK